MKSVFFFFCFCFHFIKFISLISTHTGVFLSLHEFIKKKKPKQNDEGKRKTWKKWKFLVSCFCYFSTILCVCTFCARQVHALKLIIITSERKWKSKQKMHIKTRSEFMQQFLFPPCFAVRFCFCCIAIFKFYS